jgi:ketosteroid isomerase-like protein
LLFVGPQGHVVSKQDDVALYQSGKQRITWLAIEERSIHVSAGIAVVSALTPMSGAFRGQAFGGRFRYLRVWRQTANGWQVISVSVTASSQD